MGTNKNSKNILISHDILLRREENLREKEKKERKEKKREKILLTEIRKIKVKKLVKKFEWTN